MKKPPPTAPTVEILPSGELYQLAHAGRVWAAPATTMPGQEAPGRWCPPLEIPDGFSALHTPREASILAPLLRSTIRGGRPRMEAETSDGKLMDRAMRATGTPTLTALAAKAGIVLTVLSRARKAQDRGGIPLAEIHRETLRGMAKGSG